MTEKKSELDNNNSPHVFFEVIDTFEKDNSKDASKLVEYITNSTIDEEFRISAAFYLEQFYGKDLEKRDLDIVKTIQYGQGERNIASKTALKINLLKSDIEKTHSDGFHVNLPISNPIELLTLQNITTQLIQENKNIVVASSDYDNESGYLIIKFDKRSPN